MKSMFGLGVLGLIVVCASPSYAADMTVPATAEQQLHAVEQSWVNAEIHRDAATLRRILDPAFIFTYGSGAPMRRDGFIRAIVSGKSEMLSQSLGETTIVTRGDTAIVVGLDTIVSKHGDKTHTNVYRYTVTYVRRHGRWMALAEHLVQRKD